MFGTWLYATEMDCTATEGVIPQLAQEKRGIFKEEDVELFLPDARGGYDCALSRPVSSGQALRLLVRIEGPLPGPLGSPRGLGSLRDPG